MMVVDFTTCRVPEDPASPIQVGGYIVVCAAFHEQRFGVQFTLVSLLATAVP
jgi:hypothetical protein